MKRGTPEYKARANAYTHMRREDPAYREAGRITARDYCREQRKDVTWGMLKGAASRAKERWRPCTITREDILSVWPVNGSCEDCGNIMIRKTKHAPSLDEIHPCGYIPGNIRIICQKCNGWKGAKTLAHFERVVANLRGPLAIYPEAGLLSLIT